MKNIGNISPMRRELRTYPDPILHRVAKPVEKVDDEIRTLLEDMAETMYAEDGVGLAAPQIGVSLRLAVIDISGTDEGKGTGLLKLVNPEIISREGEIEWEEGCLSVPEFRRTMKRSRVLRIRYIDERGEPQEITASGLLAVAVQQELDHLDGKLIIDEASRLKQDLYVKKLRKAQKEDA